MPGGPQSIMECRRPASASLRQRFSGPSRCRWPTKSSSGLGRMRSARVPCCRRHHPPMTSVPGGTSSSKSADCITRRFRREADLRVLAQVVEDAAGRRAQFEKAGESRRRACRRPGREHIASASGLPRSRMTSGTWQKSLPRSTSPGSAATPACRERLIQRPQGELFQVRVIDLQNVAFGRRSPGDRVVHHPFEVGPHEHT